MAEEIISSVIRNTQGAYQKVGAAYDAYSKPFKFKVTYPKIISLIEERFRTVSGIKVLDVGCGSGTLMQMLEKRGAHCAGVDITQGFLKNARARGLSVGI